MSMVAFGDSQRELCAMHGGTSGTPAMGAMAMGDMMMGGVDAHERMAPRDAQLRKDGSRGSSDQQNSDDCCCTCIGDCSVTAPVATLPSATTIRVATIRVEPRHALDEPASGSPPASADRRLPFPNGPPATRLS